MTSSSWDEAAQRLAPPRNIAAWTSPDGDDWTLAANLPSVEVGTTTVGAAIAADGDGFHGVFVLRSEADGSVRLDLADASACSSWGSRRAGPVLPPDAEGPSYVIARGRHEVYFTRPPVGESGRELWRILGDVSDDEPELVSVLPLGVEAPVSVQRIGRRDLVLAAPSRAGSGGRGVGLYVGDPDAGAFRQVGSGPILQLPPTPDLPYGAGRLGFDDREVLSAALSADEERGFILYGGRSTQGWFGSSLTGTPVLAVGTARLLMHGETAEDEAVVPEMACGNGTCDTDEDCVRCEADCPCGGRELLSDAFTPDQAWRTYSTDTDPKTVHYFATDPPRMSFAGGPTTWSVLPLEAPVVGDFDLSFDVLFEHADLDGGIVYVGLGTEARASSSEPAPESGVFARVIACGDSQVGLSPTAVVDGVRFRGTDDCWNALAQVQGAFQHVVVRRRGSRVSVVTPGFSWLAVAEDRHICGTSEESVVYGGALPGLTHLLIGFGGGAFEPSVKNSQPGTIRNLSLRSSDDPDQCEEPKQRCAGDSAAPTCVDTAQSSEHCGACGRRCGARETCVGGTCVCGSRAGVPGVLECGDSCPDPLIAMEHCGGCQRTCSEECVAGWCDPVVGDCEAPFIIPPDGGNLSVTFPPLGSDEPTIVCQAKVVTPVVGAWTPSRSGTAEIAVDVGDVDINAAYVSDSVVAITDDTTCGEWLACNDDIATEPANLSSQLTFPVEAGKTYKVGIWLWRYRPQEVQGAGLRVGFAP